MNKLDIRFSQNRAITYHEGSLENSFLACMDKGREVVFLSYRWKQGRRFAFSLAMNLRSRRLSPWLDAMALPCYTHKGDPGVREARLKKLIRQGFEKSKLAVVINTKGFASTPWTRIELDHIRSIDKPWFQVMRGGRMRKCDEPPILSRKHEEVALEILKRCALC